ncbi:asparagine synthase-related protein [Spirosoma fluminis]
MGGIAGMIRFDGQTIAPDDITNLNRLLKHRGEVVSQPVEQGIFLSFGGQLDVDTVVSRYAIADADLFDATAAGQPFANQYRQRGTVVFNERNADFALVGWDAQRQMLICARDLVGVKPLYYVHQPGRFFAFASEIKALLALREVTVKPDLHKAYEYLVWVTSYVPYSAETFYEGIYSVLPGHYLEIDAQRVTAKTWWNPNLKRFAGLNGAAAYADQFRDYFERAVDGRMQRKTSIGSHLSGGLDSSSVSCVAQQLLTQQNRASLHTFNIDTGLASTDESEYVQAVVDRHHPEHHVVHPVPDVLDSILKINRLFDRPEHFIIPSSFHLSVSLKARQIGCDCLLTGHDGDSVIATCYEYLDTLIDQSDWANLAVAGRQFVSYPDRNLTPISSNWLSLSEQEKFENYIVYLLGAEIVKRFKTQPLGVFLNTSLEQKRVFGIPSATLVTYCVKRIQNKLAHRNLINNALSADFKQRVPPSTQLSTKAFTTAFLSEHGIPVDQILNTTNVICNEQLNHIGAYYGHQYSFPFFDRQVVELGLATPLEVGFDRGRGRGLIRNGLQAVLPPGITTRLTKTNFVEYATLSAQQLYDATHEQFASPGHPIWGIIDRAVFTKIVGLVFNPRMPVQKKTRYNWLLSRIIYLAIWLSDLSNNAD